MNRILIAGTALSALCLSLIWGNGLSQRNPANNEQPFELTIQSVGLETVGKIKDLEEAYIRATFNDSTVVEFYNKKPFSIMRGQRQVLDAKLEVDPSWIKSDNLEFKLELVSKSSGDQVIIRCAQVSKGVSEYNRTYQCSVPGEKAAVLTYRLARKGDPVGGSSVASL